MRKYIIALTTLLFANSFVTIYASSGAKSPAFQESIISGKLTDSRDKPLANYHVIIMDFYDNELDRSKTNKNGIFNLKSTHNGPYLLFFSKNNMISPKVFIANSLTQIIELKVTHDPLEQIITQSYTFDFENDDVGKVNQVWRKIQEIAKFYNESSIRYAMGSNEPDDLTSTISQIESDISTERNSTVKSALYIWYLSYEGIKSKLRGADYKPHSEEKLRKLFKVDLNTSLVEEAFRYIQPSSQLWSLEPLAFRTLLRLHPENLSDHLPYFDEVLESNTDPKLKANLLLSISEHVREKEGMENIFKYYHGRLLSNYPNSDFAHKAKLLFGIQSNVTVGQSVPDFTIANFDDPKSRITNNSMRGKVYLMDFWATWCRPCIKDFPNLEKAYSLYKDKGFEIISLSLDGKDGEKRVDRFRKGKYALPWINTILDEKFNDSVAKSFQVFSLPTKILVDDSGKILALGNDLSGEKLLTFLKEKYKVK